MQNYIRVELKTLRGFLIFIFTKCVFSLKGGYEYVVAVHG